MAGMASMAGLGVALMVVAMTLGGQDGSGQADGTAGEPHLIAVSTKALERSAEVTALVDAMRSQADALVVLSGGAAKMSEAKQRELFAMLDALGMLARERRIVVVDGGTQAGVMEAAGQARRASGRAFPLIGVAPAREIPPVGQTAVDPNHSHIIVVDDPSAPKGEPSWGSETATMYWLFDRIARGRPSVAIVANGGPIAFHEIAANVEAGRPTILIEGSGRAADAVVALLRGTVPADDEVALMQNQARAARLHRRPELFAIVPIGAGAAGLLEAVRTGLGPALPVSK
ncbi:MAG: hypothetical protein ABIT71_27260 [Vicinamibacteraceae bacterium]